MGTLNQKKDADAVLSTVRRIVHEESEARMAGVVEKLLLTPALRVDEQRDAEPRAPTPLELRIAELERAVGGIPGEWEPDGSEGVHRETPTQFVMDHPVQVESVEEAVSPVEDAPELDNAEEPVSLFDGVEFDEDQLKDLVASMVRAELQGPLGERITRNVRKLVRREIHRALLTRDLD